MIYYIRKTTFVLGLYLLLAQSCVKDTCNQNATFEDMSATVTPTETENIAVNLEWQGGENLPLSYFNDSYIVSNTKDPYGTEWQNDYADIDSIVASQQQQITLFLSNTVAQDTAKTYHFHIRFPDRKDHIDCEHGGAGDSYALDFSIKFQLNDDLSVDKFEWKEKLFKGPY
ncbi:MAG: hypothetical protein ACPG5B_15745 [Chitinophagales bacterium]